MTDLTEQWKKGELPEGFYYVKDGENMIAEYLDGYFYNNGEPMTSFSGGVDEVLAPVPSYDDWMATRGTAQFLMDKNAQLKELLKECREILKMVEGETMDFSCTVDKCIDKINQALGEE